MLVGAVLSGAVWAWQQPADAGVAEVSLSVNPVPVAVGASTPVTVRWTGQRPDTLMFIRICNRPTTDPGFNDALDCSLLSEVNPNGTADGSGTAAISVFRGPEPGGDGSWGCFAPNDVAPAGIRRSTTCYVRVTNNVVSNDDDAVDAPYTIVPAPTGPAAGGNAAAVAGTADSVAAVPLPAAASISLAG